jgi:hypothetical protein
LADQDKKLVKAIAEQRDMLEARQSKRAAQTADLLMNQLDKSFLQRRLERLNEMDLLISIPQGVAEASDTNGESAKAATKKRNLLAPDIEATRKEFQEILRAEADHSAALEAAQADIQAIQQRLSVLEQARTQLQMQEYAPATAIRSRIDASTGFPHREPLPGGTPQLAGPSKNQIGPGDAVLIRMANGLVDQPISDVFYVEPMGTLALGPAYGRVDVNGLSILDAEEAVKKHLATIVQDPQVQLTLAGRAAPPVAAARNSTFEAVPAVGNDPIFERQHLPMPHDSTANVEQMLTKRIEAMNETIRELRDELAKRKENSKLEPSRPTPTR